MFFFGTFFHAKRVLGINANRWCASSGLDSEEQVFSVRGTPAKNVVCIMRGKTSKIVVVAGHFDSTSPSASTNAPGAIDNGSGQ